MYPHSTFFKFKENAPIKNLVHLVQGTVWELDQSFDRPMASPASFQHVWQAPYSRGFKFGENRPIQNLVHFDFRIQGRGGRTWWKFLVFSTLKVIGHRASCASIQHVGHSLYSRGFKFWENGPIKSLVYFSLQGCGGRTWSKFWVFSTLQQIWLGPPLQVSSM